MKVLDNNFINIKNIFERIDINNIEIDDNTLCNNSYGSTLSKIFEVNLDGINSVKDDNSYEIDFNYFDPPKYNSDLNGKRIFSINKVKKKGRIKKNRNKSGKHDKYQQDNIIRLFKVHLMNNIYKYINSSFKENQNKPYRKKILQKISSKFLDYLKYI